MRSCVGRHSPQGTCQTREKNEEQRRDGNALQDHPPGALQRRFPFRVGRRLAQRGKRSAEHEQHGQRKQCREDGLRVEELREQEEHGETDEQAAVARVARLQIFDPDEHIEEIDAGIAREKIAELDPDRDREGESEHR